MLNFGNGDTEFPVPNSTARVWEVCVECPKWKEKKNWQTNWDNAITEIGKKKFVTIVAMILPKMGGGGGGNVVPKSRESKKKKVLRLQYFYNKLYVISYY